MTSTTSSVKLRVQFPTLQVTIQIELLKALTTNSLLFEFRELLDSMLGCSIPAKSHTSQCMSEAIASFQIPEQLAKDYTSQQLYEAVQENPFSSGCINTARTFKIHGTAGAGAQAGIPSVLSKHTQGEYPTSPQSATLCKSAVLCTTA
jgi:hypothetical protein